MEQALLTSPQFDKLITDRVGQLGNYLANKLGPEITAAVEKDTRSMKEIINSQHQAITTRFEAIDQQITETQVKIEKAILDITGAQDEMNKSIGEAKSLMSTLDEKRSEAEAREVQVRSVVEAVDRKIEELRQFQGGQLQHLGGWMETERARLTEDYMKTKQELQNIVQECKRSANVDGRGGGKHSRLLTPKETTVDKLPENIDKGKFAIWVEELYAHLDNMDDWRGTSTLLKTLRHCNESVTEEVMGAVM